MRGQRISLGLLLAALVLLLLKIAWPFVSSLVLATMVATVVYPVNKRLNSRLRRPGLASLLTTSVTVVVLGAPLVFACITVVESLQSSYKAATQRSPDASESPDRLTSATNRIVDLLAKRLPVQRETLQGQVTAVVEKGARYLVGVAEGFIVSTTSILVTIVLATVFLFYLLRYGEVWLVHAVGLLPFGHDASANLIRTAHQSIIANVHGVFGVALAQGAFLGLGFWLVGIASPLQGGVFGAMASIVPFVGATLVWVPKVVWLVFMGSYGKALALGLWGGLVVGSLDNFIRPWIVGSRENQNPVLMGLAMLGGAYALGPLGLLLGPLAVSLTGAVIEELRKTGATPSA